MSSENPANMSASSSSSSSSPFSFQHPTFSGHIGVARRDITPPVGIYARNWGAATHEVAEGIHRPLTATALCIRSALDTQPLLLFSLDLGWWRTTPDEWALRQALLETFNLDETRVLVHFTHTHSGPAVSQSDADKPGGHLIASYLDLLRQRVIEAGQHAIANAQPATLDWAYGRCTLARNRDLVDPDQPSRMVCGWNPTQPADDTLLIGRVCDTQGKPLATLVNYACHPVTLAWQNKLISPDFVGAMREVIEAHTDGALCLFLQGASGELAPAEQYTGDVDVADKNGRVLGFAALSVLADMLPPRTALRYSGVMESGAPLATWTRQTFMPATTLRAICQPVDIALKHDLPTLADIQHQLSASTDIFQQERLHRKIRVRQTVGNATHNSLKVWVWAIGDAILIAQGNEAYSQLQMELRQRFTGQALIVMNLTNSPHAGYLPPTALYAKDIYQVWQSPFAAGCLETMIEHCDDLAHEVQTV